MNNKNGFALVPAVIIVAILLIGAGAYYFISMNKTAPAEENKTTEITKSAPDSSWKTYTWSDPSFPDITFQYPPDWKLEDIKEPGWEGLRVKPEASKLSKDSIVIAWPRSSENECNQGKCLLIGTNQLSTFSRDEEILGVFNILAKNIEVESNGIKIISPAKGETLEAGKAYTFKWKSDEAITNRLNAEIIGEFIGLPSGPSWQNLPASGELQVTILKGQFPEGEEKEYGPYIFTIFAPSGGNNFTFMGGNSYYGFSSPFFIKSSTGMPATKW